MKLLRVRSPQTNTDRSINVAGSSTGAVAAGTAFIGFTNPACTIFDANNWTTPTASLRYIKADDSKNYTLLTADSARDAEVTSWSRNATRFFRISNGRAIYFDLNLETANSTLIIGICTDLTFGTSGYGANYTSYPVYTNSDLVGSVSGYSKTDTEGDTFTFGVEGFDFYAKFNGVEFARVQDYRHMEAGQVALQANTGYGFRNVTLDWVHPKKIRSVGSIIDLRDFGLKDLAAIGSISASSDQLVLNTNPGFAVGDSIIVAVGGESGAGARGTAGVGGTWPALSYANTTAMDADTGQANNTYAWAVSTGNVYRYASGTLTWTQVTNYYTAKVIPRALVATITGISGLTLTLDTDATNTATAANVYYDNADIINGISGVNADYEIVPDDIELKIPEGNFAISERIDIISRDGWQLYGVGKTATMLFSPNGVPSANVIFTSADNVVAKDFHLKGNVRDNGFGLNWTDAVTEISVPQGSAFPSGIRFNTLDNGVMQDMYVTDVWQDAFGVSFGNNNWCYRVTNYQTDELKQYVQWMFQIANAEGGGCVDCAVDSDFLIAGFEAFGGNNQTFTRCITRNGVFSCNSAGSWLYEDCEVTIEANSQGPSLAFSDTNPILNVNTNIGQNPDGVLNGGTLRNFTCVQEGVINASNDVLNCISVGATNPNITIDGATITHPTATEIFGVGINQNGSGTTLVLTDVTVIGTNNNASWGNINVAADTALTNVTAERIFKGGVQIFP